MNSPSSPFNPVCLSPSFPLILLNPLWQHQARVKSSQEWVVPKESLRWQSHSWPCFSAFLRTACRNEENLTGYNMVRGHGVHIQPVWKIWVGTCPVNRSIFKQRIQSQPLSLKCPKLLFSSSKSSPSNNLRRQVEPPALELGLDRTGSG